MALPPKRLLTINPAVNTLYDEYLEHTDGDKAAAASLTLAAVFIENRSNAEPAAEPAIADPYSLTVE